MAKFIKLTCLADDETSRPMPFYVNVDHLIQFERLEYENRTGILTTGEDDHQPTLVGETPEQILKLIEDAP